MTRNKNQLGVLGVAGAMIGVGLGIRAIVRARRYMCLKDKVVLITGGSRGLGLTLARLAADEGAKIAICARDEAELNRARDELQSRGAGVLAVQCDITIQNQVDELIRGVVGHFGTIDVLINNAGIIQVGPMSEMRIEDYDEAMKINFAAALYTTMAVAPLLRGKQDGRIVNVTSIGGKVPAPHLLPYTASKFALVGFSEGLRAELAQENVFVTTVVPGLFRSGSPRNAFFKGRHEQEYAWFATADATPGMSMNAARLARKILDAAEHGDAELIAPLSAKLGVKFHGLFPGLSTGLAAMVNRTLPKPGGIGPQRRPGFASKSSLVPAYAERINESNARAHNEVR